MTFYPDGETSIPNQTPIPSTPADRLQALQQANARQAKALRNVAIVNGVLLTAAVLLAYVFPVTENETTQLAIVLLAAMIGAVLMATVLMREVRRRREEGLIAAPGTASGQYGGMPSQPDGSGPRQSYDTTPQPYGAVPTPFDAVERPSTGEFWMDVQDVFSITGRGTVVTGRVAAGQVRVGQRVQVLRHGQVVTETDVTGIEMFRKRSEVAGAGENVGLLLAGISRDQVQRADVVAT